MQNQVKAIFNSLQNDFTKAQADQGLGALGEWPSQGEHDCYITGVTIDPNSTFKESQASGGHETPGVAIQFFYQLVDDPDREEPLAWVGAPIILPVDPKEVRSEGSQTRTRIELQRLKGHMKTLLGRDPVDIEGDMEIIKNMLERGESSVVATVKCQYNDRGTKVFRSEFIQSLLGG